MTLYLLTCRRLAGYNDEMINPIYMIIGRLRWNSSLFRSVEVVSKPSIHYGRPI
jgi:hypothetical protein